MVSFVRLFSEQFSMKSLSEQLECILKGFQTFVVLSPLLHSAAAWGGRGGGCNNFTLLPSRDRKQPSDTGYYLVLEWIWIRKLELLYLDEVNSAWVIVIWSVSSLLIGERSDTTKVKSHPQSQDAPRKAKLSSSEGADFSPNILVVSTVGFVVGASFFVVLLVVVKSSTVCRHREATVSDSQEDDIVTEVIAMEPPCNSAQIEQGDTLW